MRRALLAVAASLGLAVSGGWSLGAAPPVLAEQEHQPFDANGTVLRIVTAPNVHEAMGAVDRHFGPVTERSDVGRTENTRQYAAFLTSDISGQPQIIWLDLAWLTTSDYGHFVDLVDGEAIQIELREQSDGSFLAIRYWELVKGSKVNNTDWGVQESYTTRDDSINARVHNVPDDDEALNQGDRFDQKGRRIDHDDD
ncbi:MAG: hypothetical protein IT305_03130 [Chloroflexi bacterium]|nr:hypothetical protein [Chloroflexota bacterium]